MRTSYCQFLALLACVAHFGAAAAGETLRQVVSAALERFPEIQGAQHRREAAQAQVGQARAEWLPSLSGSVGEGRETSRNSATRALGGDVGMRRREAEVSVTQLLFDGGAAGGQIRRFSARAEGAEFSAINTVEEVALRAGQVFLEVARLREQLAIARENVGAHERTLSDVSALADAGRGRRADVTQAQARRALAFSFAEQLAGQLAQAEAGFRYFTGRPPGELAAPPSFEAELPPRAELAISQALAAHPVLKAAEREVDAAQHDHASTRARMAMPRVTIEAGASRNRDLDGVAGPNHDRYAMLRLRYNFFRGFADSERVRETDARIEEALSGIARVRLDIERNVRQAWDALASDRTRLPQLAQYARASAEVAEAYRLQFQLGQRSLLDVLNAENERYNAASTFVAGRTAVAANELRLLASQGRLVEGLGASTPAGDSRSNGGADAARANAPAAACTQSNCLTLRLDFELPPPTLTDISASRRTQ